MLISSKEGKPGVKGCFTFYSSRHERLQSNNKSRTPKRGARVKDSVRERTILEDAIKNT